MTGYGEAVRESGQARLRVVIRTVNHRFFHARLKTPPGFGAFHTRIERWLKTRLSRGHVHYVLTLEGASGAPEIELDRERARAYVKTLNRLASELEVEGGVDLSLLLRLPGVTERPGAGRSTAEVDTDDLRRVTEEALRATVCMRKTEGERLKDDLLTILSMLREHLADVEERAPERMVRERDRLNSAIQALLGKVPVDPERIAREVAHLAEKWDINEEIVRLRSHMQLFRETLEEDAGPVGKRLGFIMQEMHREVNTIGAKGNDAKIATAVMALKEGVERIREQLENIQ